MMPTINHVLLAVGGSPAASIIVKLTLTTTLGLIATLLAGRNRAAVRHALLAATFGVLLTLPIAAILAPPVRIAVTASAPEPIVLALSPNSGAIMYTTPARLAVDSVVPESEGLSYSALLLIAWLAGAALFLLPVVTGIRQIRGLRGSAQPWRHGQSIAENLAFDAGIRRRFEVLLNASLSGPMTCGAIHPAIVLPLDAQTWPEEDLNRAIVHELEHVRRRDWVGHCIARTVCAFYWFHPLIWIAWRQLALEAERSCDDAVLERSEATAYADQLVGLAQRLSTIRKSPALAMANRADLAARVGAVLDNRQRRGRAGTIPVALACAAASILVVALSPLTVIAAPQVAAAETGVTNLPRFRAKTILVITDVSATDQNGNAIEGLTANDFVLTEDGKPQDIWLFEFQKLTGLPPGAPGSYYILGHYSTNDKVDGAYRRVSVILKRRYDGERLDYRAGYYADNLAAVTGEKTFTIDGITDVDTGTRITPPTVVTKVDPEYSLDARRAKYSGTLLLNVEINASGQVTGSKVIKSLGMGLDEKAIEAVTKWKFRPGTKNGQPVTTQAEVELNFRLL